MFQECEADYSGLLRAVEDRVEADLPDVHHRPAQPADLRPCVAVANRLRRQPMDSWPKLIFPLHRLLIYISLMHEPGWHFDSLNRGLCSELSA
jgi:hypothetical protein